MDLFRNRRWRLGGLLMILSTLACNLVQPTPMPAAEVEQITFDIQTATPTVGLLRGLPTETPDPNATPPPTVTATPALSGTAALTNTTAITTLAIIEPSRETATATEREGESEGEGIEANDPPPPTAPPQPAVPPAEPLRGGVWSFEDGFNEWANPFADPCPGSGLANGWNAFTSQDQFGSSCMNKTDWPGNVFEGTFAQEITFAYVGVQAGVFKSAPTIPGHRYTVEAHMKREFSVAAVEVALGIDLTGGVDWQAESVQWFPWREDVDDEWARTEETVTATGDSMTIFIKGNHPYPEPGGTLRIDAISVVDLGSGE